MIWLLCVPVTVLALGMVVRFLGRNRRQYPYEDDPTNYR
jgi:hypothetical protein